MSQNYLALIRLSGSILKQLEALPGRLFFKSQQGAYNILFKGKPCIDLKQNSTVSPIIVIFADVLMS